MSVVEKCALGLVLLFLAVACATLLRKPLKMVLRVALNSALGFGALWLLNATAAVTGLSLGLNLFNALTIGVLGVPGLGLLLNLPPAGQGWLLASLLAGTPALSAIGAFGAALTVGLRRGGLLLSLLVLPLYVPTLIFGITAISSALMSPEGFMASFLILSAISLVSIALAPFAAAAALRVHMQ